MVEKRPIILLALVALLTIIPLVMYSGLGEDEGYFGGADGAADEAISATGYQPTTTPLWEPPSGEIESLLFALQAAIGAIIIGYIFGYYNGQAKERKRQEEKLKTKDAKETVSK